MATNKKASKAKKATKKSVRKTSAKRELIAPSGDKRFVRRSKSGQFKESDDQGKSLSKDVRQKAKTRSKAGQGDKGDRK
ncbi:MAG: hypothetical protein ACXW13_08200 [Burkholderiaceae bacterium]